MVNTFWKWYDSKYKIIAPLTAALFLLQIVHLYWMTTNVVALRLFGEPLWNPGHTWSLFIALVDYTEIPAIISSSIFYIHQYRKGIHWRSIFFLFLINSQWIHLFWITDEIIYAQFAGTALVTIPIWLSWIAISIDYLEIPVMMDTIQEAVSILRKKTS